jgi:hypothetical protein
MLLQTFVQLNILLLAAPALAGWTALPLSHSLMAQAACVAVFLPAASVAEDHHAVQASSRESIARSYVASQHPAFAGFLNTLANSTDPVVTLFQPHSHSPRAP